MPLNAAMIRKLRLRRGLTQQQAASAAGWANRAHWNGLERGTRPNPTLDTIETAARVLGCKPADLLLS